MRSLLAALIYCACVIAAPAAEITVGIASVDDGRPTKFDAADFTGKLVDGSRFTDGMFVAHRDLPIGSCVEVSAIGRSANAHLAKVDDRGPCDTESCRRKFPWLLKREIDLKPKLAKAVGCDGLCRVAYWSAPCVP